MAPFPPVIIAALLISLLSPQDPNSVDICLYAESTEAGDITSSFMNLTNGESSTRSLLACLEHAKISNMIACPA